MYIPVVNCAIIFTIFHIRIRKRKLTHLCESTIGASFMIYVKSTRKESSMQAITLQFLHVQDVYSNDIYIKISFFL